MPLFRFTATVDTTVLDDPERFDYPTLDFATLEAHAYLARLASQRLPPGGWEMISVEIYSEDLEPLRELRLSFQQIEKQRPAPLTPAV